jgi:hypothetical protein
VTMHIKQRFVLRKKIRFQLKYFVVGSLERPRIENGSTSACRVLLLTLYLEQRVVPVKKRCFQSKYFVVASLARIRRTVIVVLRGYTPESGIEDRSEFARPFLCFFGGQNDVRERLECLESQEVRPKKRLFQVKHFVAESLEQPRIENGAMFTTFVLRVFRESYVKLSATITVGLKK